MTLTIIPKDVKLLLAKCTRSSPINANSYKISELATDANICYDIVIKNVKHYNKLELCLGDIVLYTTENKKDATNKDTTNKDTTNKDAINKDATNKDATNKDIINIELFTKDYPLLLTHIDKKNINFKLYQEQTANNADPQIIIEYKYEQIDTHKFSKIWAYVPATQYVNGKFMIYTNKTVLFMAINEMYRNKHILNNTVPLYKNEWLVNIYVEDCIPPALNDPIVKNLYYKIDYSNKYLGYIQFHIKEQSNLNKFLELSKVLWKEYTSVQHQLKHENDSYEYNVVLNLIAEINQ